MNMKPTTEYAEDALSLGDIALLQAAEAPDPLAVLQAGQGPEGEPFVPDTADKIDWVLGKIADARTRAARVRENMELIAREHEREAEHLEWKFGVALHSWLRTELEGSKKKSRRFSNGVLGYRTRPAAVTLTDPAAALCWARESLPGAIVETLDRKALTTALMETGAAVPFASFQPAEDVFYLK